MSVPRLFCDAPLAPADAGREIELPPDAARHAALALRLRTGDRIVLFSGRGGEFAASIARIDRHGVAVAVEGFDPIEREPRHPVMLVQSVIAAEMMDLVIRKAVELGVAAIIPALAARSQRIPSDRVARRVEHWRQIAVAACEQCGRNRIPPVEDPQPLSTWLESAPGAGPGAVMLVAHACVTLAEAARDAAPGAVVVGPEGGFDSAEVKAAAARDVRLVHLGPRVLRAETAALAALATIDAVNALRPA